MTDDAKGQSLGTLVRALTEDLSTLVRSEVALAKLELKQAFTAMGIAGAMFGAAVFFAIFGFAFLLVTAVLALSNVMQPWAAALIVGGFLIILAVVLALTGKKKIRSVAFAPTATIASVKTDIDTIKSEIARAKERG